MMNSAWNLSGDASTYKTHKKAWTNDQDDGLTLKPGSCYNYENKDPTGKPTMTSGQMSCQNPFSNISQYYEDKGPNQVKRPSLANDTRPMPNNKPGYLYMTGVESKQMALDSTINTNYEKYMVENKMMDSGAPIADNKYAVKA